MHQTAQRFTIRAAVYLFPRKADQILLSRRSGTGWMDGMYSLISGHLDGGESIVEAMIREAREEATIILVQDALTPATVLHRKTSELEYIDFFFWTEEWEGEPTIGEPDKC